MGTFNLTKKTIGIACAAVAGAVIIGMGGVFAAGQIAQNNAIGAEAAQNFAFVDAGVLPENANIIKSRFDYDDGLFYYDIEFVADGVFYDYDIKAADGTVLQKESEGVKGYQATQVTNPGSGSSANAGNSSSANAGNSSSANAGSSSSTAPGSGSSANTGNGSSVTPVQMTADEAFQKVLAEAGVKEEDAFLRKNQIDWEYGVQVFEIEFYVKNADGSVTEYEYTVNPENGDVVERSMEPVTPAQPPAQQQPVAPAQPPAQQSQGNYISVEEAKSVALSHAGVGSDATFVKAHLDHDDWRMVYEIEFYVGMTEYSVDVDAVSGTVVDFDIDYEDFD